jgi:hypothetical protein
LAVESGLENSKTKKSGVRSQKTESGLVANGRVRDSDS